MTHTTTQLRMMMNLSPFPEVREVFAASIRRRRLEEARRSKITVHPFVRSDGEDRTKHTTTLAAAIQEMQEDVEDGAIIQARELLAATAHQWMPGPEVQR